MRRVDAERSSDGSEATAQCCVRLDVVFDGRTRSEAPLAAKRRLGVVCDSVLCATGRRGAKLRVGVRGAKLRAMSEVRLSAGASGEAASAQYFVSLLMFSCNIGFLVTFSYVLSTISLVQMV